VSCHAEGYHAVRVFRDPPVLDAYKKVGSHRHHLNGTEPVIDLQAFMEDDSDDVAFVVIRTVECSEDSVLIAEAGGPLRWTEAIYAKSKISKRFLQQVATCYFQPPPPRRGRELWEDNQIDPDKLFLFHHRGLLRSYAEQHSECTLHLNALLEYMENRLGTEFAEVDRLCEQGLVTQEYISYLFKPNDLVVSGILGKPAAFVL
jgi:hypothetical protein